MKTRLTLLVVLVAGLLRCGAAPTEVRPGDPTPVATAVVTPVRLAPTPTPHCANFKICQEQ